MTRALTIGIAASFLLLAACSSPSTDGGTNRTAATGSGGSTGKGGAGGGEAGSGGTGTAGSGGSAGTTVGSGGSAGARDSGPTGGAAREEPGRHVQRLDERCRDDQTEYLRRSLLAAQRIVRFAVGVGSLCAGVFAWSRQDTRRYRHGRVRRLRGRLRRHLLLRAALSERTRGDPFVLSPDARLFALKGAGARLLTGSSTIVKSYV